MITLTEEQAQQIEEALDELRYANNTDIAKTKYYKALATIRAARAQEQAEQEPVAEVVLRNQTVGFGRTEERKDIQFLAEVDVGSKLYAAPMQQIACLTQGDNLLWWQKSARNALAKIDELLREQSVATYQEPASRAILCPPPPPEVYQMRSRDAYEAGWYEAQKQKAVSPIAPVQPIEDSRVSMWKSRYLAAASDRSILIEENNALRATPVEPAKQEPVSWAYCPECGSFDVRYEEGRHKQCASCFQEWFSDVDYSDVVQQNLNRLYAAPVRTKDLTQEEIDRLCAAIKAEDDYCVANGDYMLDSNDCIKIIRGEWVRPDYNLDNAVITADREKNK